MEMTNEEMRRAWEDTSIRIRRIEERLALDERSAMTSEKATALDNLATRYKRFSLVSLMMTPVSITYMFNRILPEEHRIAISLLFCAFFALCSVWDYRFYRGIRSIRVSTMSVTEVAAKALRYRKRHLQAIAILLPCATAMLTYFTIAASDVYMTAAIAVGVIVGLAIGLRQLMDFMADYRMLRTD